MTDILGGVRSTGADGAISKELKDHLDRQSRTATSLKASIAAANTALADFKDLGVQGAVLFKGASDWQWLAPGTAGQVLRTNGAAADPSWSTVAAITVATEQATTSGASKDFTGIPSTVSRISVLFHEMSLSGAEHILVQLGDSGGFETSGYVSTSSGASSTSGFIVVSGSGLSVVSGIMHIMRSSGNKWVSSHSAKAGTTSSYSGGGSKTLSDVLTQIRVTVTGSNTFDAGSVTIQYD